MGVLKQIAQLFGRDRAAPRQQSSNEIAEVIKQRPAQCAAAIDNLLERISPHIENPDEVWRRGRDLAKVASSMEKTSAGFEAELPALVSELDVPLGVRNDALQLIEVERKTRQGQIDSTQTASPSEIDPSAPFCVAQMLRLALEVPRQALFEKPDAYSGALWAKEVCADGQREHFFGVMMACDPSGHLAYDFAALCQVLQATGRRLPVTLEEQVSYNALQQR